MNKNVFISTTLPYINSTPHMGHCFEFVIADVRAEIERFFGNKVFFNVGIDEHGQKIAEAATKLGYQDTQGYCDLLSLKWMEFCKLLHIDYDGFYRTTSEPHKEKTKRFFDEINEKGFVYEKDYSGYYCGGCEGFLTEKDIIDNRCPIHDQVLFRSTERNLFLDLSRVKKSKKLKNPLIDLSRSNEFQNIVESDFDIPITRKGVKWGIPTGNGDVFYVWFEALLNYAFSAGLYSNNVMFKKNWNNSTIVCGKDNLKFQSYILQAMMVANDIPFPTKVLVHGTILDENGMKMSKSLGNIVDPIEQSHKYTSDALRYYLCTLNTFKDSSYREVDLVHRFNTDIVNGLGNTIARVLHLVDLLDVKPELNASVIDSNLDILSKVSTILDMKQLTEYLKYNINQINVELSEKKPFSKESPNYKSILNAIYFKLKTLSQVYSVILKENKPKIVSAFNENKKSIIFNRLT